MRNNLKKLAFLTLPLTLAATHVSAADEVNIYSYRQQFLIQPMLDAFSEETGIKTNVIFAKKGLIERLQHEGKNSPADIVLTSDIGPLYDVVAKGLTQAVHSEVLEENIPAHYRDPDDHWFGLTSRARLIYASKDRVEPGEIKTYEELTDPKWKGRICTRSGKHTYNLSLIGSMIIHHGEAEAEQWLEGLKANLARKPQGNDRAQVKAVKEGVCDLALGNSYYFGKMLTNEQQPEQKEWANSVNLVFPNQEGRGAHMSISGAALTKYAPNKQAAIQLMEFLSQAKAQSMYAEANFEFPIRPGTKRSALLDEYMGDFEQDNVSLQKIAELRGTAARMVDKVGFDN
ncbi:Fe(3+) ABC transporter substrate-binding protein [Amphritea sp. 2_MG-2023]|uniref:Fe(3+) ABC transporter substrate-binding protein n=1 Tax=Amphritea TaxID=515417 RepID=UPI001C06B2ED|nr:MULTISPECIES: Fe(3+) ABC transporter substrate-binding protein [Amphritea]MBU2965434.1 Fe(3+) ABC transporter substrate-binding protein [Amphritea atlantica]MDO6420724.1 Fe(3+) ABC transporter substrate-binding protein [Amphritea sp. 2_MG-2023]